MRKDSVLVGLVLICALALAVPAGAVTINGIDYAFFAKSAIKMEDGWATIVGNIAVNDIGGLLRVGVANNVFGTAKADDMYFNIGAQVTDCEFNASRGWSSGVVCGTTSPPAGGLPITDWPPVDVPDVDPCVNGGGNNLTVPAGGSASPPAGSCFGVVDVKNGATLTLSAGAAYNFKSLRLQSLSVTNGNGAVVNVKGSIITEPGVAIDSVTISTPAFLGNVIEVGKNSVLDAVVLTAPNGTIHLRGGVVVGVEVVAERILLGPITTAIPD